MMKAPANPERSFGVSIGILLSVVSLFLLWRGRPTWVVSTVGGVGLVLLVCGLANPKLLAAPSAAWWRFSRVLGAINARILLTVMYCVLFVPVSVAWRLLGKDPLTRRRDRWPGWSAYPSRYRDPKHFLRMY